MSEFSAATPLRVDKQRLILTPLSSLVFSRYMRILCFNIKPQSSIHYKPLKEED
jgi:hypothetical protein